MKFIIPPLGLLAFSGAILASPSFHTFTPPPAGMDITWPAQVLDGDDLYYGSPLNIGFYQGSLQIYNRLNNSLFFDGNYFATGSAPTISDRAMWGNPRSGNPLGDAEMTFELGDYFSEDDDGMLVQQVTRVAFDFAWATSDHLKVLDELKLEVTDYFGNTQDVIVGFTNTFYHNLATGAAIPTGFYGQVVLEAGQNVSLDNIRSIRFTNLWEANPGGEQGEFAIDNLSIGGPGGNTSELGPVSYDGSPLYAYSTTALKTGDLFSLSDRLYNGGGETTTFSVNWQGSSPFIYQPQPVQNVSIGPDETFYGAFSWEVDTAVAPSGRYTGEFTLVNEGNPSDTDNNTLTLVYFDLFDPPIISDNSGVLHVPAQQATLSNAAAGSHPGALRASLMIKQLLRTNPRFTVSGMAAANIVQHEVLNSAQSIVQPGQTLAGNISFNAAGAAAGTHTGQFRLKLEMTSAEDYYLNDKQPVADRVWSLTYTVPPKPVAAPVVAAGGDFAGAGIDISGGETGAAVVGGTSSTEQPVRLTFVGSPPVPNPSGYGSAVGLDFGTTEELYVLQLSYQDLPAGYAESGLRVQALQGGAWVPAISLNGNGGIPVNGAQPYAGSYAAFLAALGGGVLDAADLGAFGVDAASNTAWIVLDYEGTFQLVTGSPVAPPRILGFTYDRATNTSTLSYQSALGVAFDVSGGTSLDSLEPLGSTPVGTGGIMEYEHQPVSSPTRFFYRLTGP